MCLEDICKRSISGICYEVTRLRGDNFNSCVLFKRTDSTIGTKSSIISATGAFTDGNLSLTVEVFTQILDNHICSLLVINTYERNVINAGSLNGLRVKLVIEVDNTDALLDSLYSNWNERFGIDWYDNQAINALHNHVFDDVNLLFNRCGVGCCTVDDLNSKLFATGYTSVNQFLEEGVNDFRDDTDDDFVFRSVLFVSFRSFVLRSSISRWSACLVCIFCRASYNKCEHHCQC